MKSDPKIWPARLHHLSICSEDPEQMVEWYKKALIMEDVTLEDGTTWLKGVQRNFIISNGEKGQVDHAAFHFENKKHLEMYIEQLDNTNCKVEPIDSPLLDKAAFSIIDPDNNIFHFGTSSLDETGFSAIPARLQHVVFRSQDLPRMVEFHTNVLGFKVSDIVKDERGQVTANFMRSDPEHHSLGVFRADETSLDHFCSESSSWNDIRDWADHFASLGIAITWGAGRHGAGNNLFIFVSDPDGNNVEISAEIEHWKYEDPPREWAHEERTLNLWGAAWMRS